MLPQVQAALAVLIVGGIVATSYVLATFLVEILSLIRKGK